MCTTILEILSPLLHKTTFQSRKFDLTNANLISVLHNFELSRKVLRNASFELRGPKPKIVQLKDPLYLSTFQFGLGTTPPKSFTIHLDGKHVRTQNASTRKLCFLDIFGFDHSKQPKIVKKLLFGGFLQFLAVKHYGLTRIFRSPVMTDDL